jgi:hypothetical protein
MNFLYLTERGTSYQNEEGQPFEKREWELKKHVAELAKLEVSLRNALAEVHAKPVASPAKWDRTGKLVNFFEGLSGKQSLREDEVRRIRRELHFKKMWLTRQGLVFRPGGGIDWTATLNVTVAYDHTLAAQGLTRVYAEKGRLFRDEQATDPLDTGRMVTTFSGPGYGIFVMSATGNLHVSSHNVGVRHHSSLLAGANVAGAGEMKVVNGVLKEMTNKTGHYHAKPIHLVQVLHRLAKFNVGMGSFKVSIFPGPVLFATAQLMLNDYQTQGVDYELGKLMRYAAHLTPTVLAKEGWVWDSTKGNEGVNETATGKRVPPKAVRKRFKALMLKPNVDLQSGTER